MTPSKKSSKKKTIISIKNSKIGASGRKNSVKKPFPFKILNLILFLVLIFIIGSILTIFIYNKYNILKYQEINMSVRVQNGSSSFNTSTEALNFARIYPGGEVVKRIDIHSLRKSLVRIEAEGSIADFIYVSDNNFIMEQDEYKQVEINLVVPVDTLEGSYDGKLKIYFLRK